MPRWIFILIGVLEAACVAAIILWTLKRDRMTDLKSMPAENDSEG